MLLKQVYEYYDRQKEPGSNGFTYCPLCQTQLVLIVSGQNTRLTCPSCEFIQYKNPSPVVSIIIEENNKILLGKRTGSPGEGKWALPSGYIEYGDDFISTAIHEIKEETGLEVEIKTILNVLSSFVTPSYHFLVIYLEATPIGGKLIAGDDLDAVKWVPVAGPFPEMAFQEDIDMLDCFARNELIPLPVDSRYAHMGKHNRS